MRNEDRGYSVWEREPTRSVRFFDPQYYCEEETDVPQLVPNSDCVYIINGMVKKMDKLFKDALDFNKVVATNIYIGTYI